MSYSRWPDWYIFEAQGNMLAVWHCPSSRPYFDLADIPNLLAKRDVTAFLECDCTLTDAEEARLWATLCEVIEDHE